MESTKAVGFKGSAQNSAKACCRSFSKIENSKQSNIFVISGPSGSGKGTLVKRLLKGIEGIALSVSATTRHSRADEVEGKDYYFLSEEEFAKRKEQGDFLEVARVHGFYYGTLKQEVLSKSDVDLDVILEIDPQGAFQIREKMPEAVLIFVKSPSLEALEKRLRERGTESEEVIQRRLADAKSELNQESKYDYVIINRDIEEASEQLIKLVRSKREK